MPVVMDDTTEAGWSPKAASGFAAMGRVLAHMRGTGDFDEAKVKRDGKGRFSNTSSKKVEAPTRLCRVVHYYRHYSPFLDKRVFLERRLYRILRWNPVGVFAHVGESGLSLGDHLLQSGGVVSGPGRVEGVANLKSDVLLDLV